MQLWNDTMRQGTSSNQEGKLKFLAVVVDDAVDVSTYLPCLTKCSLVGVGAALPLFISFLLLLKVVASPKGCQGFVRTLKETRGSPNCEKPTNNSDSSTRDVVCMYVRLRYVYLSVWVWNMMYQPANLFIRGGLRICMEWRACPEARSLRLRENEFMQPPSVA